MKEKYFNWENVPDNLHVIISNKNYGKTYYEIKKLNKKYNKQKEVLDKIKEILNNEMYPDIAKRKILELLEEIE